MTLATSFTRDDCLVGKKRRSYETLQRDWCCNVDGGGITLKWSDDGGWHPECAKCGGCDFIHKREWERQAAEAVEVLDGLPADLAAALGFVKKPDQQEIYSLCPEQIEL